ncbi:MAG: GTPase ObgE [Chloroflexota bacterium]|nr:GTPase ObgE [Chloroflexota bacterium]MDQ6907702.1 GTPase ObgE [Chloroflexota bacterium]
MLIDRAKIHIEAGKGGNGSAAFRREKFEPRGGPDGGDGGRGGDVILFVNPHLNSLLPFQFASHFKAQPGVQGASKRRKGARGADKRIAVPPGTTVRDAATGDLIVDLTEPDETAVVAHGGRGGLGNTHYMTSTHQAPRMAELGEPGAARWITLELRLIADAGLVGFPNAGKSTFLTAITRATPKIGAYPFTTLEPNLGVVAPDGERGPTFVLADIPGLIEGAADGRGLGHDFLRHVERTRVLIHVLDGSGMEMRDPLDDFHTINAELKAYQPDLAARPQIVAFNKMDTQEARDHFPATRDALTAEGYEVFPCSAATGEGLRPIINRVAAILAELPPPVKEMPTERLVSPNAERRWHATRLHDGTFAVRGTQIERVVAMTNFDLDEGVARLQRVLDRTGISKQLARLGALDGSPVVIGNHTLAWVGSAADELIDEPDVEADLWDEADAEEE